VVNKNQHGVRYRAERSSQYEKIATERSPAIRENFKSRKIYKKRQCISWLSKVYYAYSLYIEGRWIEGDVTGAICADQTEDTGTKEQVRNVIRGNKCHIGI